MRKHDTGQACAQRRSTRHDLSGNTESGMHMNDIDNRNEALLQRLRDTFDPIDKVAIAFSSGVDSTLLLKAAQDCLGTNVLAITAKSASVPAREIEEARSFCERENIRHVIVEVRQLEIEGLADNPPNRCYLCKREILSNIISAAHTLGFDVVAEGSNADDASAYRPGFNAVKELGVISPLMDAGLAKADVRALARHLGLEVWNKPAYACLITRIPYGEKLTQKKLAMVEQSEYALHDEGFLQARVRVLGNTARIEVPPDDIERLMANDVRMRIDEKLRAIGFAYVSCDLQGYRTGSMDETL